MDMIFQLMIPAVLVLVALIAIGIVLARLYRRSEKDRAYVRTGFGGQKVVLDGGSLVLPVFHSIAWVNLQTLRLDVRRDNAEAMISKDRMRVDIGVEFYVRVMPDALSIGLAAQTLGARTNDAALLRELVEAKFVDALRSVAATMTLADLQEQRAAFVKSVQNTVSSDLELNGLELESASLTKLDQTDTKYFNPNNAFDAEGLTALTKITEAKRQERNQTVRSAEVNIAQQDLDARQKTLEIERQKKEAELNQQRDIVNKSAATRAESALKEAEAQRAEATAKIEAEQAIAERQALAKKVQESATIDAQLAIAQKQTEADRTAETLRIAKQRDVELADQDRSIVVAAKSQEQSVAQAKAEEARAVATSVSPSNTPTTGTTPGSKGAIAQPVTRVGRASSTNPTRRGPSPSPAGRPWMSFMPEVRRVGSPGQFSTARRSSPDAWRRRRAGRPAPGRSASPARAAATGPQPARASAPRCRRAPAGRAWAPAGR